MKVDLPSEGFVRLNQIIKPRGVLPIGRSRFYALISEGEFPPPKKLGSASLWAVEEIRSLLKRIEAGEFAKRGKRCRAPVWAPQDQLTERPCELDSQRAPRGNSRLKTKGVEG